MTAQEAYNKTINNKNKLILKEYVDISLAINSAISKGEFEITSDFIYEENINKLKQQGYTINTDSGYVEISWDLSAEKALELVSL